MDQKKKTAVSPEEQVNVLRRIRDKYNKGQDWMIGHLLNSDLTQAYMDQISVSNPSDT